MLLLAQASGAAACRLALVIAVDVSSSVDRLEDRLQRGGLAAAFLAPEVQQAFFSSDHTVSNLVTYDEWRGFRLKPPLFAIMVGLLASLMVFFQARKFAAFLLAVAVFA